MWDYITYLFFTDVIINLLASACQHTHTHELLSKMFGSLEEKKHVELSLEWSDLCL